MAEGRDRVAECERALRAEPDNLALRVRLAEALRAIGRGHEARGMLIDIALELFEKGSLSQASAVCGLALDIEPDDAETRALRERIDARWLEQSAAVGATEGWRSPETTELAGTVSEPEVSLPPELERFSRAHRLLDVKISAPAAMETPPPPPPAATAVVTRPPRATIAPEPEPEPPPADLAAAFESPFRAALAGIAPDGSAIEDPLGVFSELPAPALAELEQRMNLHRLGVDAVVVCEGDSGESAYVVREGEVRVLKQDPDGHTGELIEVARLGPGSLFGEFALLADRRRHATVQTTKPTVLCEIPRRLLRELAERFPGVTPALERLYRARLIATLLSTAPFFAPVPAEERAAVLGRFSAVRAEGGEVIIHEGDPGGGLFLVVLGGVEVTRAGIFLAAMGEGSYFGEMSLLTGVGASATVTAVGAVELARLAPNDFYSLLAEYPAIWDAVKREARRRAQQNQQAITGSMPIV